jgi:hypothetical protein
MVKPVTKLWYNGWVGAVKFSQYVPKTDEELTACAHEAEAAMQNCECCPECSGYWKLVEIGQTSGMDEETRTYMTEHTEELIGKVIEVGAMERIKKTNALRHPRFLRFRDDKLPRECIVGEC